MKQQGKEAKARQRCSVVAQQKLKLPNMHTRQQPHKKLENIIKAETRLKYVSLSSVYLDLIENLLLFA
jgi:hypothetical protein